MLIFGTFKQSIELEQSLAELEDLSILKEHILVVFMDTNHKKHQHDPLRPHAFEVGMAFSTGVAVIGASIGFVLTHGPIIWGLLGAFSGFLLGVSSYYLFRKLSKKLSPQKGTHEVLVIIQCEKEQSQVVSELLWKYQALSVGYSDNTP